MTVNDYEVGTSIMLTTTFKVDGVNTDPDTSINIEIKYASDKTSIVAATAMSKSTTGIYTYNWQTSEATHSLGEYEVESTIVHLGVTSVDRDKIKLIRVKDID